MTINSSETFRLFLAIKIPENVLDEIIKTRDEIYGTQNPPKWEKKKKLHLTIKFFGNVKKNDLNNLCSTIEKALEGIKKFKLSFGRFELFYKYREPKILWVQIRKNENLNIIFENISENINISFNTNNKKFKPHLTLLRIKGNEDFDKLNEFKNYYYEDLEFDVKEVYLIKSELKPTGSEYTELKKFELK